MLASDADIDMALQQKLLVVEPTEPELLQPASIDLRLDDRFRFYLPLEQLMIRRAQADPLTDPLPNPIIDPGQDQADLMQEVQIPRGAPYLLGPGQFVLASTMERIQVSDQIAAKLEGKSSLGRLGLQIHATAGWIDPGFAGHITLELFNVAPWPLRLWPGMKIGQLSVMALNTPARRPYGTGGLSSHYQNQPAGPQPSQGWRHFKTWPMPHWPAPAPDQELTHA